MSTLDPISIATKGYVCGLGPDGISIATRGYVCMAATFQEVMSGIITMAGSIAALFIAGVGATDAQKNQGGTSISTDIGID